MNDFTHHSENYVLDGKQKGNIFVILEAIRVSNVSRVFFSTSLSQLANDYYAI